MNRLSLNRAIKCICLCVIFILAVGCSSDELKADSSINEQIKSYVSEHTVLSLDKISEPWDMVLIDSVYDFEDALENLKINDSEISSLPSNDEIVVAFISDNKLKSYAVVGMDETEIVEYLDNYLYQNTHKTYPRGTQFTK